MFVRCRNPENTHQPTGIYPRVWRIDNFAKAKNMIGCTLIYLQFFDTLVIRKFLKQKKSCFKTKYENRDRNLPYEGEGA